MPQTPHSRASQARRHPAHAPRTLAVALMTTLATAHGASFAQPAAPGAPLNAPPSNPPTSAADATRLPSVTVTARRGEERARDIPFGVDVIDADTLEARGQQTLEDAVRSTPSVNVWSDGSTHSANILIRGTGSINPVSTDDGSVALSIDGVGMSMRNLSLGTLDIERVEILKGPQGTLFGSNSRAGAINVTTNRPTRHLEGHLRAEYGQDQQHLQEAVVSGPLTDALSGRVAIRNSGAEHWVDNAGTGDPLSKPRSLMFRGSLLWEDGPGSNALLTVEREVAKRNLGLTVLRPYGGRPAMDVTPGLFDDNEKTVERYALTLNHDLAASRITSVTAYTAFDIDLIGGYDALAMQAMYGMAMESMQRSVMDGNTVSQDLRWSSLPGAEVFWVAGANVSRARRTFDQVYLSNGFAADRRYDTDSHAVYGELTYPLGDALKLTGGLRHSWDRKSYDATYGDTVSDRRRLRDDYSTGRLALSYALTPATNVYGAWSRGYESGGVSDYPTQPADSMPYKPAVSNAIEIGFKTASADGRLMINGAVFHTRVKDDHLLGFDPSSFATATVNADTRSRGVELQGEWRFTNGFSLSGGVSYIDAEITNHVSGVSGGDVAKGNRSPDVPEWSATLGVAYTRGLPAFMGLPAPQLNARLDYQYVGTRAATPQNHFDLKKYQKVDMRVGVMAGATEVYVFGSNLLDEAYDLYGYAPTTTAFVGAPARGRSFGVGLRYDF